jgi:hypothetical protein
MTTPFPRRLQLLAAMNEAYARGDLAEAHRLEDLHLAELTGRSDRSDALTDRIAALEARLDARRRVSPGQLEFDLTGGGKGPGGGEPCGNSWIDPNKTCRKTQGAPTGPIDTSAPFSKATMERLVSGIERRAFNTTAARHNGTDLALAMQKLAEAPGLTGEHAREAMAFMEEVGARVIIAPTEEFAPQLEPRLPMPEWDIEQEPWRNAANLNAYLQERLDTAKRGRSFAKQTGLWSDALLKSLEADRSPHGEALAKLMQQGRDGLVQADGTPLPEATRHQELRRRLAKAVKDSKELPEGEGRLGAQLLAKQLFLDVRGSSFHGGPDDELTKLQGAIRKALSSSGTNGHYQPGGNIYWKVSMAGKSGSRLDPDEVGVKGMQALLSNTIAVQDKRREFTFSSTTGLKESEIALTTHIHELGHMIHDASSRKVRERLDVTGTEIAFRSNAMDQATPSIRQIQQQGNGPTRYSNTNVAELFAESYVGYVVAPDQLRQSNPELYDWVERTMKQARRMAVRSQEATNWYFE